MQVRGQGIMAHEEKRGAIAKSHGEKGEMWLGLGDDVAIKTKKRTVRNHGSNLKLPIKMQGRL